MITREEAKSFENDACDYNGIYYEAVYERIDQIYNSFEQHIKSLEAKLANTEQLTCDGCKWFIENSCTNANNIIGCECAKIATDYYTPKDTK